MYIVDKVSVGLYTGLWRMNNIGCIYDTKKQHDKSLAWYIQAARENNSTSQSNIGTLYFFGRGVPKNYLCALKWFLKAAEKTSHTGILKNIDGMFENRYGVPLDKYKALEWYCHGWCKTEMNTMKGEGYHQLEVDKGKFNYIIVRLC
jgi:tetratricopeptide (TPR) repeat protein